MKANTVVIGNGSGNLSVTNMNGLNAGDVLAITPGTYSGATFSNLTGVAIINNGGVVNFNGRLYISNLTNVTIAGNGAAGTLYGFVCSNASTVFTLQGKCTGLRMYNFDNTGIGTFFNCSANGLAHYDGNPANKLLLNTSLAYIRLTSSGELLQGSYGVANDFNNVIDSISVANIIINNTTSNGQELAGASIFHLVAHDWTVTGPCPNGSTDVGIVQISGNARVYNIYRNGGYGYIMRIVNVGLDGVADSYLYNCIDLNSWQYGTIDTRIDPTVLTSGTTPPYATGGNIHVLNNTSGNKTQADNYTTVVAVIGSFTGYKCEVRNNLSFNTFQIQNGHNIFQINAADPLTDTSNNMYFTSAQIGNVLVDQVNCFLLPNSPAIDKGYSASVVTTDIGGVTRPQGAAYDIGAREYASGGTTAAPVANAGANQTITLPTNSVSLDGSASTFSAGTITGYSWVQTSGPTNAPITNSASAKTTVTGLIKGTYIFTLTVTGSNGTVSSATVTITVNPGANLPPVANAGANQSITLPTNTISLNGGASTDPDGTIASYSWVKTSGPAGGTIVSPTGVTTVVNSLVQGTYVFTLTVTDNSGATSTATTTITVNAGANTPPNANAGPNQSITLPTNSVSLNGSGSFDPDGTIASYSWAQTSGPATSTLGTPAASTTIASNLVKGSYVFTLTVTDNGGATSTATVTITVNAAANIPPVADAGNAQSITLPINSVTLDGSQSHDPDGTIASYGWVETSGPAQGTITSATSAKTTVTGLAQGVYVFTLSVTDNSGATTIDQVTITVNAAAHIPPVANPGNNMTITLPTSSVNLNGSGSTDPDGTITSYSWTQVSGAAATISNGNTSIATVSGLQAGTYTFQLTVTDNLGATGSAQVKVTVSAAVATPTPIANAGANQTITLPVNSATLNGSASQDINGTISTYAWTQTGGPVQGTITSPGNATTTAGGLVQTGVYTFQLVITDAGGLTSTDNMTVTVLAAANIPPVANPGANQSITLPTNTVTLDGTASYDPDGTIASYSWTKVSGGTATITSAGGSTTTVTGLQAGQYVFQLIVTDNQGATGTAQVKVTVNAAANLPPIASASSQSITLPINTVTLDGTASYDPDGTIASYSWTKVSGGTAVITTPGAATTTVTGLQAGQYVFQLTVTDNQGATGTTQVIVIVSPAANQPPIAVANSVSITLPVNSVTIDGSQSYDPDGTIASYSWTKLTGPAGGTINDPTAATTTIGNLLKGQYVYQLTVTDNKGATGTTQIIVTVNVVNEPPVAVAGPDQTITLPVDFVQLDGRYSYDVDGTIATYSWVKISGPGAITITNSNSVLPTVYGVVPGIYVFQLTVTDNNGLSSSADVTIVINAAPNQPVAMAGSDTTVAMPANTAMLNGSNSYETGGSISTYQWQETGGPSSASISSDNSASTAVNGLTPGQYTFLLTVWDSKGVTDTSSVTINVVNTQRSTYLQDQLIIYPNPATDLINIRLISDTTGNVAYRVFDITGRLLYMTQSSKQSAELDSQIIISSLTKGSYFLQAIIGSDRITSKFIKQ